MSPMSVQFSTYDRSSRTDSSHDRRGAAADLPEARDAGLDHEPAVHVVGVPRDLAGERGARADERHRPAEHVEQLRQLVEAVAAQEPADAGHPRVGGHLEQHLVAGVAPRLEIGQQLLGVVDHRAELEQPELAAVQADAHLAEQHRPVARGGCAIAMAAMSGLRTMRPTAASSRSSAALGQALALAVARRLDVDQREPGDRAGLDARADDVDDARREHEVLAPGLELPRDALDDRGRQFVGARDRHGVGLHGCQGVRDRQHDRHDRDVGAAHRPCPAAERHARAHDEVAGARGARAAHR